MFSSIRWRLITSYILLTLLAVSLVGFLTLSLVRRYMTQQERDYLAENAAAVALQAEPFMGTMPALPPLHRLVSSAAFLSSANVRILDPQKQVITEVGGGVSAAQVGWFVMGKESSMVAEAMEQTNIFLAIPNSSFVEGSDTFPLPADTDMLVIQTEHSPWGGRLNFNHANNSNGNNANGNRQNGFPPHHEQKGGELISQHEAVLVPIGDPNQPKGFVEMSSVSSYSTESLETLRQAFLVAGGGVGLLAIALGLVVGGGLTAPLRELAQVAGTMSSGNLAVRAPVHRKDEIGLLAREFNQMAEQLETSFAALAAERDALRRFIADASHELRTPITALKNFIELLQGAAAHDPTAQTEFLGASGEQVNRLTWITENLLNLSRFDAGLVYLEQIEIPVVDLLSSSMTPFMLAAQEKGIALEVEMPASTLTIYADRARLEMAFANLIDNALKFTPIGGKVTVGSEKVGNELQLWVQDTGIGITNEDLPRIFQRFYRAHGNQVNGSGLGLAIVQSIVQAHGGKVTVESRLNAGTRFTITLPDRS